MLSLHGDRFTCGRAKFLDRTFGMIEATAKIYVRVRLEGLDEPIFAQLDTGAAWSVLSPELATKAKGTEESDEPVLMRTALGRREGFLMKIPVVLVAEEGESMAVEPTFFVPSDWPKDLAFLGYSSLLDSIRFAIDPEANDFYFGPFSGRR